MEEKAQSRRSMTTSWMSNPCILPGGNEEKSRSKRAHFPFRGLTFGHLSRTLLMLSGFHSSSRNSGSTSSSTTMPGTSKPLIDVKYWDLPFNSSASDASSSTTWSLSRSSSVPSSPSSRPKKSISGRRKGLDGRKPVLLEKVPFGKAGKYLTVYIGSRNDQSVKYVISRSILKHPLFQLLLKCSEDEFGEDYTVNKGVAIVCDPALFLEVVRAVDDDVWSLDDTDGEELDRKHGRDL